MRGRRGGPYTATTVSSRTGQRPESSDWIDSQDIGNGVEGDLDEEEAVCPLCIELLDETEQRFRPCPCGYRVCLFCYERIKLELNSLCPSCRTPYGTPQTESPPPQGSKSRPEIAPDKLSPPNLRSGSQHLQVSSSSNPLTILASEAISSFTSPFTTTATNSSTTVSSSLATSTLPSGISSTASGSSTALVSPSVPVLWNASTLSTGRMLSVPTPVGASSGPPVLLAPLVLAGPSFPSGQAAGLRQPAWSKVASINTNSNPASNPTSPVVRAPWAVPVPSVNSGLPVLAGSKNNIASTSKPAWTTSVWNATAASSTLEVLPSSSSAKDLLGSNKALGNSLGLEKTLRPLAPPSGATIASGGSENLRSQSTSAGSVSEGIGELQNGAESSTRMGSRLGIGNDDSVPLESKLPVHLGGIPLSSTSPSGFSATVGTIGSGLPKSMAGSGNGQSNPWGNVRTISRPSSSPGVIGQSSTNTAVTVSESALSPAIGNTTVGSNSSRVPNDTELQEKNFKNFGTPETLSDESKVFAETPGLLGSGKVTFSLSQFNVGAISLSKLQQQLQQIKFSTGWSAEEMQKASAVVAAARAAQAQVRQRELLGKRLNGVTMETANCPLPSQRDSTWGQLQGASLPSGVAADGGGGGLPSRQRQNWTELLDRGQAAGVRQVDSGAEMSGEKLPERPWQAPNLGANAGRPPTPGSRPSTPGSSTTSRAGTPSLSRTSSLGTSTGLGLFPAVHYGNGFQNPASGSTSAGPMGYTHLPSSGHLIGGLSQTNTSAPMSIRQMSPQRSPPLTPGSNSGSRPGSRPVSPPHPVLPSSIPRATTLSASAGVFIPNSQSRSTSVSSSPSLPSALPGSLPLHNLSPPPPPPLMRTPLPVSLSTATPSRQASGLGSSGISTGQSLGPNLGVPLGTSFNIGTGKSIWGPPGTALSDSSSESLPGILQEDGRNLKNPPMGTSPQFSVKVSDALVKPNMKLSSTSGNHQGVHYGGNRNASYRPPDLTTSLAGNDGSNRSKQWNEENQLPNRFHVETNSQPLLPGRPFRPLGRSPAPYRPPLGPPSSLFNSSHVVNPTEGSAQTNFANGTQQLGYSHGVMDRTSTGINGYQQHSSLGFLRGPELDVLLESTDKTLLWRQSLESNNSHSYERKPQRILGSVNNRVFVCEICQVFKTVSQEELDEHIELCKNAASIVD